MTGAPHDPDTHRNYRAPNFQADGKLYLMRCYECGGERGRENYALMVPTGQCAWCGWPSAERLTKDEADRQAGTGKYGGGPGKFRGET